MLIYPMLIFFLLNTVSGEDEAITDGESSRKVLGSSVVTSVSVIMDTGNGSQAVYTDAAGRPVPKPSAASDLASPIDLLNPDRYEFYTFDDDGDLVKRLMTLDEIQGIIATGDGDGFGLDSFTSHGLFPEKRVADVVNNVQNVLKEEIESHKKANESDKPFLDTPDVSETWSMILPAVFGNSGEDIKPEKPIVHVTPDTIMIEPTNPPKTEIPITVREESTTAKIASVTTTAKPIETTTFSKPISVTQQQTTTTFAPIPETTQTVKETIIPETTTQLLTALKSSTLSTTLEPKPIQFVTSTTTNAPIKVITTKEQISTTQKIQTLQTSISTEKSATTLVPETEKPLINVEIITNSNSTTQEPLIVEESDAPVVEIKPLFNVERTSTTTQKIPVTVSTTITPPTLRTTTIPVTSSRVPISTTTITTTTTTTTIPIPSVVTEITTTQTPPTTQAAITTSAEDLVTSAQTVKYTTIQNTPTTEKIDLTTVKIPETTHNIPILNILEMLTNGPASKFTTIVTEKLQDSTTKIAEIATESTTPQNLIIKQETTTESDSEGENKTELYIHVPDETTVTETPTTLQPNIFEQTEKSQEDNDDLKTLSTEYVTKSIFTTTNAATKEIENQTIEINTQKLTPAEILDNLLLSTTNIYEINSELSERPSGTTIDLEDESSETTVNVTEDKIISTAKPEQATEAVTDQSLVASIEQIISQTVDNVEELADSQNDASKIEELLAKINRTVPEIQLESATMASSLVDSSASVGTTTANILEILTSDNSNSLSDAVGSLLSQVYGSETTLQDLITTEKIVTTDKTVDVVTTTEVPTTEPEKLTSQVVETTQNIVEIAETTAAVPVNNNKNDSYQSHIINITIIPSEIKKNLSKPAKADFSQEIDYEDLKNGQLPILHDELQKVDAIENIQMQTTIKQESTTTSTTTTTTTRPEIITILSSTTSEIVPSEASSIPEPITEHFESSPTTVVQTSTTQKIPKPSVVITINETDSKTTDKPESTWTLVSTLAPHGGVQSDLPDSRPVFAIPDPPKPIDLVPKPLQGFGLEDSTSRLDTDVYQFAQLCNELAFGFWKSITNNLGTGRSIVVSPFASTSLLAMVFLGARGATSGEMNEILKLDDMVTFNPHLIFKNVTESLEITPNSGIAVSAIVRELYSDKSKGKLLSFYKERVKQFYDGHVEEVSFREIGDTIRRRTNLLVKKHTGGKISEFLRDSSITPKPPLAGISVNVFQTDCSQASTEGRDGELHFVVLPSMRQRRLIPIPAAVWRSGFLAGYEPSLDATAVALGDKDQVVSTILVIPGQQGIAAPGDGLTRLEKRLVESSFKKGAWSRLLRSLIPRPGLELQIPRFSHRSVINATLSLKKMGLKDLFDAHTADLRGLNGAAHELHLSDMIQINNFATCGEKKIGEGHHTEVYPATAAKSFRRARTLEHYHGVPVIKEDLPLDEPRDYQRAFNDPLHDPSLLDLPLALRPRQARLPETPRLRFDRPFLYFVRHNPTGLILHMGRFNPRLLP